MKVALATTSRMIWRPTTILVAVSAMTFLCWLATTPSQPSSAAEAIGQLFGAWALAGFAVLFLMTTRHRWVDGIFDGLDKAYVWHKWIGMASVSLVVIHLVVVVESASIREAESLWHALGIFALVGFAFLAGVALLVRNLTYERWKLVHRCLVFPYVIGLVHYFGSSSYTPLGLTPLSLWMDLLAVAGTSAAIYSVFLYQRIGFPHVYRITGLRLVAERTMQITGQAASRPLNNRPGQFAFLTLPGRHFNSHPFTISRGGSSEIEFTIKALGDHTSLLVASTSATGSVQSIKVGDMMGISQAYGRFDFTTGDEQQIWIAAGIGITPFRAFLHSSIAPHYSIDLFYSFSDSGDAPYLDTLAAETPPNVRVHLVNTHAQGRLTASQIAENAVLSERSEVYFCGPQPMRDQLKAGLRCLGVRSFHFEEFEFLGSGGAQRTR